MKLFRWLEKLLDKLTLWEIDKLSDDYNKDPDRLPKKEKKEKEE